VDFDPIDFDIKPGWTSKFNDVPAPQFNLSNRGQVQRQDLDDTLSLGLESEPVAIELAWSPPGISFMHDCLLALLDSHHRVSIWQSTGVGNDQWKPVRPQCKN